MTYCGCLADPLGELLLGELAGAQDRLEGVRFLDRVEVLAVQVLVDGQLERRAVAVLSVTGTCSSPASLAAR